VTEQSWSRPSAHTIHMSSSRHQSDCPLY